MYLGGLCFITDRKSSALSNEDMVIRVLEAGVRWIQYREKDKTRREIYEEAVRLREITKRFNSVFIVNDHPDIASSVGADGVHLGQEDLPVKEARKVMGGDKIIGISTHDTVHAVTAEDEGADYVGFGPVFHTTTKNAGSPKGIDILRDVKTHLQIPVVAIGGITVQNVRSVLETGVDAVAVASAILKGEIAENIKRFFEVINSYQT